MMVRMVFFLLVIFQLQPTWANEQACEAALQKTYPLIPLYQKASASIKGLKNPFESDMLDANVIGKAHDSLGAALDVYGQIYKLKQSEQKLAKEVFASYLQKVEDEVQKIDAKTSIDKRFALLEAIRLLQILESRVEQDLPETSQEEAKQEEKKEKEKEKQKDKKASDDQKEEEQPFEWSKIPDKYSPENKDIGNSGGKAPKPVIILRSEAITDNRLYPRQYYDVITGDGFFAAPLLRTKVVKQAGDSYMPRQYIYVKNPKTQKRIENIPVPDRFDLIPGNYPGYTVREVAPQEYDIEFTKDPSSLGNEVAIQVIPIEQMDISQTQGMSVYTERTGIDKKLWPAKIRHLIAALKSSGKSPMEVAQAVKEHLSGPDYIYFSRGSEVDQAGLEALKARYEQLLQRYPKVIAMAHLESFNCDGAAWIGAAILRDFFGIPARVAGGSTAESGVQMIAGKTLEVISSGSVAHAWTQVWDSSKHQWIAFDMTPKKNTPDGEKSDGLDLKPREDQEQEQEQEQEQKDSSSSKSQSDSSSSSSSSSSSQGQASEDGEGSEKQNKVSDEKQIETESQPRSEGSSNSKQDQDANSKGQDRKDAKAQQEKEQSGEGRQSGQEGEQGEGEAKEGSKAKDKGAKKGDESDSSKEASLEEAQEVERNFNPRQLKSRSNSKKNLREKLIEAFYGHYLKEGIANGFAPGFRRDFDRRLTGFLNAFKSSGLQYEDQTYYLKKMDLQASLTENAKMDLVGRLRSANNLNSSGKLRDAWMELRAIQSHFDDLKRIRQLTPREEQFYAQLLVVLREYHAVRHPESGSFDLIQRLFKALPGNISKKSISSRYPNHNVAGHMDTLALATNIINRQEESLVRLAMASPYTDLFLNAEKIPQYQEIKTFDRSYVPNKHRDIVRTTRISDFPRMILQPKPGEHIFAATIKGEQFAVGYTEPRRVANPRQSIEKKVTMVYYDVSGSMGEGNDSRLALQDALIMSLVDRALSEVDYLGRQTHVVYLTPFDDGMGEPLEIRTREEAEQFITLARISRKSSGRKGTEIQPVLMDFYNKVALAHQLDKTKNAKSLAPLKRANLVLFSDGGSEVDYEVVKKRRDEVAALTGMDMHLNFVSIEQENADLKNLAMNVATRGSRSTYYYIDSDKMADILKGRDFSNYDPEAFAFNEKDKVPVSLIEEFKKLMALSALDSLTFDFHEFERILDGIRVRDTEGPKEDIELKSDILDVRDALHFLMKNNEEPMSLKLLIAETALKEYLINLNRDISTMTRYEYSLLEKLIRLKR